MNYADLTCIGCPLGCAIHVEIQDGEIINVTGNTCKRGEDYARKEVTHPTRIVTSTVSVENGAVPVVSVKTNQDIPKEKVKEIMDCLQQIRVQAPIYTGDVIVVNVAQTGVDIVATKDVMEV